jgi:hypothetical protein
VPEALARRLAAFERGNALPSGLPLDLRADIEDATDLYAYAQRLRVQADERQSRGALDAQPRL